MPEIPHARDGALWDNSHDSSGRLPVRPSEPCCVSTIRGSPQETTTLDPGAIAVEPMPSAPVVQYEPVICPPPGPSDLTPRLHGPGLRRSLRAPSGSHRQKPLGGRVWPPTCGTVRKRVRNHHDEWWSWCCKSWPEESGFPYPLLWWPSRDGGQVIRRSVIRFSGPDKGTNCGGATSWAREGEWTGLATLDHSAVPPGASWRK